MIAVKSYQQVISSDFVRFWQTHLRKSDIAILTDRNVFWNYLVGLGNQFLPDKNKRGFT